MAKISVIDPQNKLMSSTREALKEAGYTLKTFVDFEEALESFDTELPDVVVTIAVGTGVPGAIGFAPKLRSQENTANLPLVLIAQIERSGWDRTFATEEAFAVDALLDYPCDVEVLIRRLDGIITARESVKPLTKISRESGTGFEAILERAIANEEAAAAFYDQAAKVVQQRQTQDILKKLADDERKHRQAIIEFKSGERPLPSGNIKESAVLEAFGSPELSTNLSPTDAFLLAARKEKAAVDFYENWAALYSPGPEQQLLKDLAEMERSHKAWVEDMFSNISFPETWE